MLEIKITMLNGEKIITLNGEKIITLYGEKIITLYYQTNTVKDVIILHRTFAC